MATDAPRLLKLGPEDHGRLVSSDDFADADFAEPWKYERVRGRLVVMPPDGELHISGTSPWWRKLFAYWEQRPDRIDWLVPASWVRVSDGTDRIGDIGVYLSTTRPVPKIPDRIPDLMFEIVSPGRESRDRDYIEKRAEYHALGIREYVIVDPHQRKVTVLTHRPEGYDERELHEGETYASPLLPGLAIDLAGAFA